MALKMTTGATRRMALDLREAIGDVGFPFWVRCYRDGDMWVGAMHFSPERRDALKAKLEAKGFRTACNGRPGTSGEGIVEVFLP